MSEIENKYWHPAYLEAQEELTPEVTALELSNTETFKELLVTIIRDDQELNFVKPENESVVLNKITKHLTEINPNTPASERKITNALFFARFSHYIDHLVLNILEGESTPPENFTSQFNSAVGNGRYGRRYNQKYTELLEQKILDEKIIDKPELPSEVLSRYEHIDIVKKSGEQLHAIEQGLTAGTIGLGEYTKLSTTEKGMEVFVLEHTNSLALSKDVYAQRVSTMKLPFADVLFMSRMGHRDEFVTIGEPSSELEKISVPFIDKPNCKARLITIDIFNKEFEGTMDDAFMCAQKSPNGRYLIGVVWDKFQQGEKHHALYHVLHEYRHVVNRLLFSDMAENYSPDKLYNPRLSEQERIKNQELHLIDELIASCLNQRLDVFNRAYLESIKSYLARRVAKDEIDHPSNSYAGLFKKVQTLETFIQRVRPYIEDANDNRSYHLVVYHFISMAQNLDQVIERMSYALAYIKAVAESN